MNKICINPKNYKLTQGQPYTILDIEGNYYYLVNDSNRTVKYDKSLFDDELQTEEEQAIPAPPPPAARTEQDCINSIIQNEGSIQYTNLNGNTITVPTNYISVNNSHISCGVFQLNGISDLMYSILDCVDTTENDCELLIKELFVRTIRNTIEESEDHRFIMMSTNYEDNYEDFYTYLNEMSVSRTEWASNPNSGNDIKVWVLENI